MKTEQHTSPLKNASVSLGLAMILLAGCSPDEPTRMSTERALALESELAADPKLLKEMQRRCKYEREMVGDQVCAAVAGAARKRFMGSGETNYTPEPVDIPHSPDAHSP